MPRLGQVCALCGTLNTDLVCGDCAAELPLLEHACQQCAIQLPVGGVLCGSCQKKPPVFDRAWSLYHYEGALSHLVHRLKYRRELQIGHWLGARMAESLVHADLPDVIIPVPLHRKRLQQRGFNQAMELARPVASRLGISVQPWCCKRTKHTAPQFELPADQRRKNVAEAFACPPVPYHRVVVIDDVMTTTATANAVAKALKNAGVEQVTLWLCARAQHK